MGLMLFLSLPYLMPIGFDISLSFSIFFYKYELYTWKVTILTMNHLLSPPKNKNTVKIKSYDY